MKMKHNNKGFSLVELIVVIAIMAILGGVGTVGYTKYIESSSKKADKVTVGNIMRAAEHGAHLFTIDDPLQMSGEGLTIPLGFVVLTNEGMSGMESDSVLEIISSNAPCQILPIGQVPGHEDTIYPVVDMDSAEYPKFYNNITKNAFTNTYTGVGKTINLVYWPEEVKNPGGTYCYTCSLKTGAISSNTSYQFKSDVLLTANIDDYNTLVTKKKNKNLTDAEKARFASAKDVAYVFADLDKLVTSGCVDGEKRAIESYDKATVDMTANGTIAQMMNMAFGDDYQNVSLKGDWNIDDLSNTLPTMYATAESLLEDLENMLKNAINDPRFGEVLGNNINSVIETYLPPIADRYANSFTKEEYIEAWRNLANDSGSTGNKSTDLSRWGGYFGYTLAELTNGNITAFGNKAGYMAGVGAYNAGFASYVRTTTSKSGAHDAESCAEKIVDYGDALEYGSQDSFNDAVPVSAKTFAEGGKLECPACESLLTQYLENEAWKPNAETFYDLMKTVDDTSVQAITESKLMDESYFDWYKNYISEFQNFYGTLDGIVDNAESAIVIMFHRNPDNTIGFNVFPEEANPRNK